MDATNENAGAPKNQQGLPNKINGDAIKQILIIVVAGLVLLAGVWIWKSIDIRNIKNHSSIEKNEMQEFATSQISQSHEMHLKSLVIRFVWAVRSEMLDNDIRQVRLYANDMVQEKKSKNSEYKW